MTFCRSIFGGRHCTFYFIIQTSKTNSKSMIKKIYIYIYTAQIYKSTISPHFPLRGKVGQLSKKQRALCWSIYVNYQFMVSSVQQEIRLMELFLYSGRGISSSILSKQIMKYKRETKDRKERENIFKRDNKGTLNKERRYYNR